MKQSKFTTDASQRFLSCLLQCLCLVRSDSINATQSFTADSLLFTSMIDPLFTFSLSMVGSRWIFFFNISMLCLWMKWYKYMVSFLHSLPKQMHALDKIFTTVSSASFVHTRCYIQHKMKVPLMVLKVIFHVLNINPTTWSFSDLNQNVWEPNITLKKALMKL